MKKERAPLILRILCFFIPLVGLILFLYYKSTNKTFAKDCGIPSLIGFCLSIITVIVCLASIGIITMSAKYTQDYLNSTFEEMCTVPNLVGMHKDEAKKLLEDLDLSMEIQANVPNNDYPADYVVSQVYGEGYQVKSGVAIGVTLSAGTQQILVPDVSTLSVEAAKTKIKANDLLFEIKEEYSGLIPKGEIIRQEPKYNTKVTKGDTITIYVSGGTSSETRIVPDISGYDEIQAKDIITKVNLIPVVTYINITNKSDGKIIDQTPEPGSVVNESTEVMLIVNKLSN